MVAKANPMLRSKRKEKQKMICCKIVSDFNSLEVKFGDLLEKLGKYGDVFWHNNNLFFADYENDTTDKAKVSRILKKCGCTDFYICVYTKDNVPQETDEANIWLTNRLIKMNYNLYERQSQEMFREISKGLDLLNEQVSDLLSQQKQEQEKKEGE